jgi:hypothetical protein
MTVKLIGNPDIEVDLLEKSLFIKGEEIIEGNAFRVDLFGGSFQVTREWLISFARYNWDIPKEHVDKITFIRFAKTWSPFRKTNKRYEIPVFDEPMVSEDGYAIIPTDFEYEISREGVIRNRKTKRIAPLYEKDYLFCSLKGEERLHRTVALVWCYNENFETRPIVNHKDGNKLNPHADNLEWSSFSENAIHAFKEGLRDDNKPCVMRNIFTGEVTEFYSVSAVAYEFGLGFESAFAYLKRKMRQSPFMKEYEFVLKGDPWEIPLGGIKGVRGRYLFTIEKPNGEVVYRTNIPKIISEFKLWNLPSWSKDCVVERMKEEHPDWSISVIDYFRAGEYQVKNLQTGEVIDFVKPAEVSWLIGVPRQTINKWLTEKQFNVNHNGWVFREKSSSEWDEVFPKPNSKKAVLVTDINTGKVSEFESVIAAASHFGINKRSVGRRILSGSLFESKKFSYKPQHPS